MVCSGVGFWHMHIQIRVYSCREALVKSLRYEIGRGEEEAGMEIGRRWSGGSAEKGSGFEKRRERRGRSGVAAVFDVMFVVF